MQTQATTAERIALDAHVHIYPGYDLAAALEAANRNLTRLAGAAAHKALILAERHDCAFFEALLSGRIALPEGWKKDTSGEDTGLWLAGPGSARMLLVAGSQIATSERIEILALCTRQRFEDGKSASESLERVRASGGLPVLCWSPGKWLGARGRLIAELIDIPGELCVGDSALRPWGWGTPRLIRRARALGRPCLYGSDPLPIAREEERIGRYGTLADARLDATRPVTSLRMALLAGSARAAGARLAPWEVYSRLKALSVSRGMDWLQ